MVDYEGIFADDITESKGTVALVEKITDEFGPDFWMKPSEVAAYFKVDPKTVSKWYAAGKMEQHNIRAITTPGGHRRYNTADIMRLVEENGN